MSLLYSILFYFIKNCSITCTCCLLLSKYKKAHEVLHGEQTVRLMDKLVPLQWEPIGPWMEPVLRLQTPAAGWVAVTGNLLVSFCINMHILYMWIYIIYYIMTQICKQKMYIYHIYTH